MESALTHRMPWTQILFDLPPLKAAVLALSGALLLIMVRISFLLRTHGRLSLQSQALQQRIVAQHGDVLTARQDANAWRGQVHRMMDAFRADFSQRMEAAGRRSQVLGDLEDSFSRAAEAEPVAPPVEEASKPFIPLPSIS